MFVALVMQHLPVMESRLHQMAQLREEDEMCKQIRQYCLHQVNGPIAAYLPVSGE